MISRMYLTPERRERARDAGNDGFIATTRNVTFQVTDDCCLSCSYCISGDTQIMMVGGKTKPIRDVVVGDAVLAFDEKDSFFKRRKVRTAMVRNTFHRKASVLKVVVGDGSELFITPNHKVLTGKNKWQEVGDLKAGDTMYLVRDGGLKETKIVSTKPVPGEIDVYNIETTTGTYIANGIAVHNCYQICKGQNKMSRETARKCVDLLFDMYERNDDEFINHDIEAIILDFIGGEPLMAIDIIDYVCTYFYEKCIELNHPWAYTWRASMTSNGALYFKPEVQAFLKKFSGRVSFAITLDGPKEIHDACRVHHDGTGNFDEAYAAMKHFNANYYEDLGTKVTIAPENLADINKIVRFFVDEGMKLIHANPVYETEWTVEQARLYYTELKKMADYLLELNDETTVALFDERLFEPMEESDQNTYCGGTGKMLAFDPNGVAYPCLRYMKSSLGDSVPAIVIGDCENGLFYNQEQRDIQDRLCSITRRSQNTDECYYCPIAKGCSECFPDGTLISTPDGFRNISEIEIGDMVIDKDGVPRRVYSNVKREASNLVRVSATGLDELLTTEEHPFWCKPCVKRIKNVTQRGEPRWVEAKDLKLGDQIALYIPKLGDKDINKDVAWLVGYYIGDGSKSPSYRKRTPFKYDIPVEAKKSQMFGEILDRAGVHYSKHTNKGLVHHCITATKSPSEFIELISSCGRYSYNKFVPLEVYSWNKESVEAFLEGYFAADGWHDAPRSQMRFTTTSKALCLGIAELVRAVYHRNVSIKKIDKSKVKNIIEGRLVNVRDSYEGRFLTKEQEHKNYEFDEKNNIMWANIRNAKRELPEKEIVYNLSVEENPSYIADDALVHNCAAWSYQQHKCIGKRSMNICNMHKARSLANVYYWNKYYALNGIDKKMPMNLPKDEALKFIDEAEYEMLQNLVKM